MPDIRFDSGGHCFHVDADGDALYPARYRAVSSYADGLAVAHKLDGLVVLIDLQGRELDLGGLRFAWMLPPNDGRALAQTVDGRHGWIDRRGVLHPHQEDPEWTARLEVPA